MTQLANNLEQILKTINSKAKLLAVTKSADIDVITKLYELGQRDFGENRVDDLADKAFKLKHLKNLKWHFIGNLQRKKVKDLLKIPSLYAIHSVDSLKLALELNKRSDCLDQDLLLYFQVNTSGEKEKAGFENSKEVLVAMEAIEAPHLIIAGLMTMATIRTENQRLEAKKCFIKLVQVKNSLNRKGLELSMGMSQDFEIALEVGTDWVRVGSKLFD